MNTRIKTARVGDLLLLGKTGEQNFGLYEPGEVILAIKKTPGVDGTQSYLIPWQTGGILYQSCDGTFVTELAIIEKGFGNDKTVH